MYKIVSLDLSLVATGVTVLTDNRSESFLIKSKRPKDNTPTNELIRILNIIKEIDSHVVGKNIDLVCIEGMAFCTRNTSALIQLGVLNYFVRHLCYKHNIKFCIIAPTTAKRFATGRGNSKKDEIMLEVYKRWKKSFSDDNLCDSFVLAKIGQALLDKDEKITKTQQEVINLLKKQLT